MAGRTPQQTKDACERLLATAVLNSMRNVTPGGIERSRLRRRHPLLLALAWLFFAAVAVLYAIAYVTR